MIWEFFNFILSMTYYQSGIETGYLTLFLLFIMFYYWGKKNQVSLHYFEPGLHLKNRLSEVVAGYGWISIMRIILLLILMIPFLFVDSLPTLSGTDISASVDVKSLFISFSLTGILTPVVEEFVFRGVIFDLTSSFPRRKAMLFQVLLFAVLHMNLLSIINALFSGIAFYELREKNNDIISCILLHILMNVLSLLNINSLSIVYIVIVAFAIVSYILSILKWKKSPVKSEASKKNLCVKY